MKIAEVLVPNKHHLINKAAVWNLREMGCWTNLAELLAKYFKDMSRTKLCYTIKKFEESLQ